MTLKEQIERHAIRDQKINDITINRIQTMQNCLDTIRKLVFNIEVQLEAMREEQKR